MSPDALAALHAACFDTPRPWSAAELTDLVATPGCFLITVPTGFVPGTGFVLGRAVADEAELLTLAVAPAARRRGTGKALTAAFADEARRRGAGKAFLEVAADNAAARALYAKAGWQDAGRRPGYYRTPTGAAVDALVMRRALGGG